MREWLRIRSLAQGHPTLEWEDFPQTVGSLLFPLHHELPPATRWNSALQKATLCFIDSTCDFMAGALSSSEQFFVLWRTLSFGRGSSQPRGPCWQWQLWLFQNLRISRCCLLTSQCLHSKSTVTLTSLLFCSSFSLSRNAQKLSCTISATWLIRDPPGPGVNSHQAATLERLGSHTLPPWIVAWWPTSPGEGGEEDV